MHWFTAFVLYVLLWWVALFAILPIGTRPQIDSAKVPGGWRGAPERPLLGRKLLATTLIAGLLWGVAVAIIDSGWISFRSGGLAAPSD